MSRVEYIAERYTDTPAMRQATVNTYTQSIESGNKGTVSLKIHHRLQSGAKYEYMSMGNCLINQAPKNLYPTKFFIPSNLYMVL